MIPFLRLKNKFSKEKLSLGLDIGTQAIKLIKLRFINETAELCDFALEPAAVNIGDVLKKIIPSHDIKNINISVCGPATIIRYVNFPRMNDGELRQALKFEAQKHIPFPINEINLDAYILKDLPDNKMLVLLVAVKKEFLEQRIKVMETAGLKLNAVDIDSIALVNAFNFNYLEDSDKLKTVALLNIGAQETNLNILEDKLPRLSRDIHIAGNNFTQKLKDTGGVDFKPAEELKLNAVRNTNDIEEQSKISNGINPDKEKLDKVCPAIESAFSNLVSEVRTSFDYYESQSASSVTKIFLSGGGSKFSGLKDMLANLLGIEVEFWDPFKQINIPDTVDASKLKALSSQLAVAVGLALRK